MDTLESFLILSKAPKVGSKTATKMLQVFGHPLEIINASNRMREKSGLFKPATLRYFSVGDFSAIKPDLDLLKINEASIIHLGHSLYPPLLAEISDPPLILFGRGNMDLLKMPQLSIVGSRNPDLLGKKTTFKFAKVLAQNGVTITSGMAMGIDKEAHCGALLGAAGTIAVLGTGIDKVYPASHKELAHKIVSNGLMLSEFGANTQPRAQNFPIRNRIISGLSLGTLVVQAKIKSGSLITARMAMEQGREVFAIPGSINNPLTKGCHYLIKQGVKLVEDTSDIFNELEGMLGYAKEKIQQDETMTTNPILEFIEYDPMPIDSLPSLAKMTIEEINAELIYLELDGKIEVLSGAKVQRI